MTRARVLLIGGAVCAAALFTLFAYRHQEQQEARARWDAKHTEVREAWRRVEEVLFEPEVVYQMRLTEFDRVSGQLGGTPGGPEGIDGLDVTSNISNCRDLLEIHRADMRILARTGKSPKGLDNTERQIRACSEKL